MDFIGEMIKGKTSIDIPDDSFGVGRVAYISARIPTVGVNMSMCFYYWICPKDKGGNIYTDDKMHRAHEIQICITSDKLDEYKSLSGVSDLQTVSNHVLQANINNI